MSDFILGFSGTRYGMTQPQIMSLRQLLYTFHPKPTEFWHGDCVGADAQFHDSVLLTHGGHSQFQIWPSTLKLRAHCDKIYSFPGSHYIVHPPGDARMRTIHIAQQSKVLLVAPFSSTILDKGGTWLAYHTAIAHRKQTIIIWPSGQTEEK